MFVSSWTIIPIWKIGYVLGTFVTPICFQMATCACNPCVIVACKMSTNWKHAQYQSWMDVDPYTIPSLKGELYPYKGSFNDVVKP